MDSDKFTFWFFIFNFFGGILFLVLGIRFLFLISRNKKLTKIKSELESGRLKEKETRENTIETEIKTIENLVKQNSVFDNGKLIHIGRRNAIVFSRTGEIGIFAMVLPE